jgi:uncharacterized protein YdaT
MPWNAKSFASKHNHKLAGTPAAGKAARVATALLGKGYSDASAIRIGNSVGDKALSHEGGGAVSGHWIKGAIKHPGALHRDLGVPEGEKIPAAKLKAAEHSDNPKTRKRAQLADTMKHFATGGKVKTFPIPSRPAPSGGEDNQPPKFMGADEPDTSAYAGGGMIRQASYAGGGAVCNSSMRYAKGGGIEPTKLGAFHSNAGPFK